MNKEIALKLIDTLMDEGASPVDKERAAAQLRELITLLLE